MAQRSVQDGSLTTLGHQSAQLYRSGDLVRHVAALPENEFGETLEGVTSEFEQLLRALDSANHEVVEGLVAQVLEAVTIRIRDLLAADRATVFLIDDTQTMLWQRWCTIQGKRLWIS